jgi:hypothetical protein
MPVRDELSIPATRHLAANASGRIHLASAFRNLQEPRTGLRRRPQRNRHHGIAFLARCFRLNRTWTPFLLGPHKDI